MANIGTMKAAVQMDAPVSIHKPSGKFRIKDPGSAITHFIGMVMAAIASVPLLIKAAHQPDSVYIIAMSVYAASLILLYAASTTYHTFDISERVNKLLKKIDHMMISILYTALHCVGHRHRGHPDQGLLDLLPEMGIFRTLHRHGMDLCAGIHPAAQQSRPCRFRMAACRRDHLHHRRRDLRAEASTVQQQTPELRQS